jgi:hypothetical protein
LNFDKAEVSIIAPMWRVDFCIMIRHEGEKGKDVNGRAKDGLDSSNHILNKYSLI